MSARLNLLPYLQERRRAKKVAEEAQEVEKKKDDAEELTESASESSSKHRSLPSRKSQLCLISLQLVFLQISAYVFTVQNKLPVDCLPAFKRAEYGLLAS